MNALPSFEPPQHPSQRNQANVGQQPLETAVPTSPPLRSRLQHFHPAAKSTRLKSNPTYAHRRQGLEVVTKLVTYSTLSIFGMVTLVNSIGYNWSQRNKLQHITIELQDAKVRTEKVQSKFSRSFAPESQTGMMQENSYKVAPDRLQIFLVNPNPDRPQPKPAQANPHS
ncbi:hypothetical protein [Chamaesiphon sp.]|uniref:slr1601 family putative cell division protein n=1 Tax=Chamaesiphon sp. TaxID=2814140 RepID=UPI003593A55B